MLFGTVYIEIPDMQTGIRTDVEALCAALQAIKLDQEHYETTILQSLLVAVAASVTSGYTEEMGFDDDQVCFCHDCEAGFIATKLDDFKALLRKRMRHVGFDSDFINVSLDDMRLTAALVFLEEFAEDLEEHLEEQIALAYEASEKTKK